MNFIDGLHIRMPASRDQQNKVAPQEIASPIKGKNHCTKIIGSIKNALEIGYVILGT